MVLRPPPDLLGRDVFDRLELASAGRTHWPPRRFRPRQQPCCRRKVHDLSDGIRRNPCIGVDADRYLGLDLLEGHVQGPPLALIGLRQTLNARIRSRRPRRPPEACHRPIHHRPRCRSGFHSRWQGSTAACPRSPFLHYRPAPEPTPTDIWQTCAERSGRGVPTGTSSSAERTKLAKTQTQNIATRNAMP